MMQESQYFLNKYDPFSRTKQDGITESLHVMKSIALALVDILQRAQSDAGMHRLCSSSLRSQSPHMSRVRVRAGVVEEAVELFVLRSLWGNKADLSLFSVSEDPLALVHQKLSKGSDSLATLRARTHCWRSATLTRWRV
jgi:hypothetical protein